MAVGDHAVSGDDAVCRGGELAVMSAVNSIGKTTGAGEERVVVFEDDVSIGTAVAKVVDRSSSDAVLFRPRLELGWDLSENVSFIQS